MSRSTDGPWLGVDLGSVRIGVAICEASGLPSVPLATINHRNPSKDVEAIVRLADERAARTIVLGSPLNLDGSAGWAASKTESFATLLRQRFAGQVVLFDERLTTVVAAKKLRELPAPGSRRRRHLDQLAAVEILNSYLATQES